MRFILAEKPTQAKAIAEYLSAQSGARWTRDANEAYRVDANVIVAADGHLFEDFMPEDYDPRYREWRIEDLPFFPKDFRKKEKTTRRAQAALATIRQHIARADAFLHACDFDREGQLIGDEIFHHFKVNPRIIERLPITGYDHQSLATAFATVGPNDRMRSLSTAALLRSRADMIWGINFSRLFGIEARKSGYREGIPIGRVISPTLNLLAERERKIAEFTSVKHYAIKTVLSSAKAQLVAKWVPGGQFDEGFDEQGRLVRLTVAEAIRDAIGAAGVATVVGATPVERRFNPPLPYTLAALQVEANAAYGYTAKQVHDAAESLYSLHFLISYPRADSRYYPTSLHERAPDVLAAIRDNIPSLGDVVDGADPAKRSRAFDDAKVAPGLISHHAIAPLVKRANLEALSIIERSIYELICRTYIAQFYPDAKSEGRSVELAVDIRPAHLTHDTPAGVAGRQILSLSASSIVTPGWRPVMGLDQSGVEKTVLDLNPGERLAISYVVVDASETHGPRRFTDGTLIAALNDLAESVDDPELKEALGANARLGTASTQSEMIERLIGARLIERDPEGKLRPTVFGRAIGNALPKPLKGPALTVQWERELDEIANGKRRGNDWLAGQMAVIEDLVHQPVVIELSEWHTSQKKRKKKGDSDDAGGGASAPSLGRGRSVA